jgi:hypothetical protein
VNDFSKPWVIWDTIVLAHLLNMTTSEEYARPTLRDDMQFEHPATNEKITWITSVQSRRMWPDFLERLDAYQSTHAIPPAPAPVP